jgi:MFS family permease
VSLAGIAVPLMGGVVIATVHGVSGYPGLFITAFLVALVEVWLFSRLRGHPRLQALPPNFLPAFRRLWADNRFRHYTLASLPFYLGWVMSWPLFLRYQVVVDHASNLWMAILPAANAVFSAVMARVWGRLGDRHPIGVLLPIAIMGLAFVPFVYALGPSLEALLISSFIGGSAGAGVNMFLLLRLMQVTPEGDRIIGMALANTLIGIASVVGPLLATLLATFIPMPGVFWIPFGLRFFGGLMFLLAYRWTAAGPPRMPSVPTDRLGRARPGTRASSHTRSAGGSSPSACSTPESECSIAFAATRNSTASQVPWKRSRRPLSPEFRVSTVAVAWGIRLFFMRLPLSGAPPASGAARPPS